MGYLGRKKFPLSYSFCSANERYKTFYHTKLSNVEELLEIVLIITIPIFLCQNVRVTGVSTAVTERLRMASTPFIVTTPSDLDGSALRDPQAQECQLHVHLHTGATLIYPDG